MKKLILIAGTILVLFGCQKQDLNEQVADKWNGYEKFYKAGEVYKDIIVGRNTVAGTMTYGIDDNANFYATFAPNSDYQLEETYLYAGTWRNMPKSKDGDPKMSRFPLKTVHNPMVDTYTYLIPLTDLPPCEYPGFVVSAYAELRSVNKCGERKSSWGKWDRRHEDKTSGGYFTYYYNEPEEPHKLFYVHKYDGCGHRDTYLIDKDDNDDDRRCTKISSDTIDPTVTYVGMEKDPNSTNQLQAVNPTDPTLAPELFIDPMGSLGPDNTAVYSAGSLVAGTTVQNSTILGTDYYYVDALTQNIYQVPFSIDGSGLIIIGTIANIGSVSTLPAGFTINDIAMKDLNGVKILTIVGPSIADPTIAALYNLNTTTGVLYTEPTPTYETGGANLAADATIYYDTAGDLYVTSTIGNNTTLSKINTSSWTVDNGVTIIGGGGVVL